MVTKPHVFISYSHKDAEFAENLQHRLEKAEFEVWLDQERLRAGEDWREEIDAAIYDAFALVLILSPDSMMSPYVMYEWSFAWGARKKVIPVLFKNIGNEQELHPRLDKRQYLNFTNRNGREWEKLIKRLEEILVSSKTHPSPNTSPEIVQAIGSLKSWNSEERQKAATFLGTQKSREAIPELLHNLHDDEDIVVVSTAKALGEIGDASAVEGLSEIAMNHPRWNVRYAALKALNKIKSDKSIQALIKALYEEHGVMRQNAAKTLIEIGGDLAVSSLLEALTDEYSEARKVAAWVLGGLRVTASVPHLIKALSDLDSGVRAHAAGALGDIRDLRAVDNLINLLSDKSLYTSIEGADMAPLVCQIAAGALEKIATGKAYDALQRWRHEQEMQPLNIIPLT